MRDFIELCFKVLIVGGLAGVILSLLIWIALSFIVNDKPKKTKKE